MRLKTMYNYNKCFIKARCGYEICVKDRKLATRILAMHKKKCKTCSELDNNHLLNITEATIMCDTEDKQSLKQAFHPIRKTISNLEMMMLHR